MLYPVQAVVEGVQRGDLGGPEDPSGIPQCVSHSTLPSNSEVKPYPPVGHNSPLFLTK